MVRKWLQSAIDNDYLPVIASLKNTAKGRRDAEALNQRIRQDWDEHGAKALSQKQGLSDELRRYLKDQLGADHWVLDYLGLTTEEYAEINELKQGRVAERNEATQQIENPDAIVAKAVELLGKPGWDDIAAGLAVLTGRRVAEILSTAEFEKKSQWSVTFRGALKRRGEEGLEFEIPTLTTADRVLRALSRLRDELPEAVEMDAKTINRKFEQAVAKACDRAFSGLVPTREGKDNLYTHLFRAVYATIASFWYCPPSVNETEFRAAVQGHYAIQNAEVEELRRSLAASRHYSDYEIADKEIAHYNGKRKGIKLGVAGVLPIEVFKEAWEGGMDVSKLEGRKVRSSFRVWHDDKIRLDKLLEAFQSPSDHQLDRFHRFLDWAEKLHGKEAVPPIESVEVAEDESYTEDVVAQDDLSSQETESIHMQIQEPEQNMDMHQGEEIRGGAIAPSTESRIDRLIMTMEKFVEVQLAIAAASGSVVQNTQSIENAGGKKEGAIAVKPIPLEEIEVKESRASQTRVGAAETALRIDQAIDAVMAYNDAPGRKHTEKWAIGINTLKAFVKNQEAIVAAIGGRNRKGENVTGFRQAEIEKHHQKHQIDPNKHNYYHRGKLTVDQVVEIG